MNCRIRPCAECPWVKATPPGQFPARRYEALRDTTGESGNEVPIGSPIFACHKSQEGRELPCAGWLASVGVFHLGMRLAAARGELGNSPFRAGDDWPELHGSYDEMVEAMLPEQPDDPRFTACIDFLRRTGMREFQFRYDEEQDPIVFVAGGYWADTFEADCSVNPLTAVVRLAERIGDGGQCAYCEKPTGVSADWEHRLPLDEMVCWWVCDPETKAFRRGCEAEVKEKAIKRYPGVGRNDDCPCGSGKKYKRCHGK